MEDDVLKLKEVVSVTFDTTPLLFIFSSEKYKKQGILCITT